VATRPAAVAGLFYPASAAALRSTVLDMVDCARAGETGPTAAPKVLIVPHAGYVYSGSTAARGYAQLEAHATIVRRVVLIGPAHRVPIRGVAVPSATRFATPLGTVEVDQSTIATLLASRLVEQSEAAHAAEHAL
jgi:AmmeMemoRadiSam system protein B